MQDVTDQEHEAEAGDGNDGAQSQAERDRLYEERMEDEYAKREGGA